MEVSRTLQPGEMGTKHYLDHYGDKLVCVRYRINKKAGKRYTTIELIVNEKPLFSQKKGVFVWLRIGFNETELREKAKTAGAKWLAEEKYWEMEYETMKTLGLKNRVVKKLIKQ
ncbi:MAG TPA: hypothetical protein ENJ87_06230 [Gammaproteobacteria bacterium]|nr:hypothetical protein [Gammaproteobacteria bacterium]